MLNRSRENVTWQELREQAITVSRAKLKGITKNQEQYLEAINKSIVTICVGPAGTGKSYMACGRAAEMLSTGVVKKIIITRPLVTCSGKHGKGIGFLPGEQNDKVTPYMRPLLDAFEDFIREGDLKRYLENKIIEMWPLDLMRGASLRDALIICDEAQNAEYEQLYMFLTRFAKGSKVIITGDDTKRQNDLQHITTNPLKEIVGRFAPNCHKDISIIRLGREDMVRHPLIQWIDERLSDEPVAEVAEGRWFDEKCLACGQALYYEDNHDDVDQIKCFACSKIMDLWAEGEYAPALWNAVNGNCVATYPEKV